MAAEPGLPGGRPGPMLFGRDADFFTDGGDAQDFPGAIVKTSAPAAGAGRRT